FQFPRVPEYSLALDGLSDDRAAVGDGSLRWQNWQVPQHGPGALGLLYGSPARLLFSLLRHHRLCVYPARTLAFSVAVNVSALRRLRLQHFSRVLRYG